MARGGGCRVMDDEPTFSGVASLSMKLYVDDEFHESRTLVSPDCFGTAGTELAPPRLEKHSDARRAPIKSQRSRSFVRFRGDVAPRVVRRRRAGAMGGPSSGKPPGTKSSRVSKRKPRRSRLDAPRAPDGRLRARLRQDHRPRLPGCVRIARHTATGKRYAVKQLPFAATARRPRRRPWRYGGDGRGGSAHGG